MGATTNGVSGLDGGPWVGLGVGAVPDPEPVRGRATSVTSFASRGHRRYPAFGAEPVVC